MKLKFTYSAIICFGLVPQLVEAHMQLVSPAPRYNRDSIKPPNGPCGDSLGLTRSGIRTSYEPGSTITISFDETIDHRGHFAVYFSEANDLATSAGSLITTLVDSIPDPLSGIGRRTASVTLPNISCDTCTLQVIQWMDDINPYFSCADISLVAGAPPPPEPPPFDHGHDHADTLSSDFSGGCGLIRGR